MKTNAYRNNHSSLNLQTQHTWGYFLAVKTNCFVNYNIVKNLSIWRGRDIIIIEALQSHQDIFLRTHLIIYLVVERKP